MLMRPQDPCSSYPLLGRNYPASAAVLLRGFTCGSNCTLLGSQRPDGTMYCGCEAQLCTMLGSRPPPASLRCNCQTRPRCKGPAAPEGCRRDSQSVLMPCGCGAPHTQRNPLEGSGCTLPSSQLPARRMWPDLTVWHQLRISADSTLRAGLTLQARLTSLSLMMRFSSSSTVLVTNTSFRIMVSFLYCELLAYRSCRQAAQMSSSHALLRFCWQQRGSSSDTHLAIAAKLHLEELVAKFALVPAQRGAPQCQQGSDRHQQQHQGRLEAAAHPT